jgi:hypothetical protein
VRRAARRIACGAALALASFAGATAFAQPRLEDISSYSPYERETIQNGLSRTGGELDLHPDGKIIEGVDVITLEVIEPRDPIPTRLQPLVNFFHVTTKPHFVKRELLFKVGDPYERRIVEESARNLRGLSQLSVVILVPTKGSAPDRVRMLLVTKDLWSLRVPLEYRLTSSAAASDRGPLEYLQAQITEINLLGTHHQASFNLNYNPDTISVGGSLIVPRMWDSRLRFVVDANAIYNYRTSAFEGTYGTVSYYQPLFSLATEWSYGATMAWNVGVTRRYIASEIGQYDPESTNNPCRPAEETSPREERIPCQYRRDYQKGELFATRSFGRLVKHNLRAAVFARRQVYRPFDLAEFDPNVAAAFVDRVLPLSDNRFGAALQYQTFAARFMRLLDVEKMGIQEEYQLGHNLILSVAPAYAPLRGSKSVVSLFAGAAYTVPLGDGMARGYIESQTDFQPADAATPVSDGSLDLGGRLVSPRIGIAGTRIGRLVFDTRLLHRYANYLNDFTTLGGNTRLRGYPTGTFGGKDLLAFNLEFRLRPFEILKTQLGAAVFYDAGDAFDDFTNLRIKQSAGFGLRLLLPQINRIVIRADWGFPLTQGYRYGDQRLPPGYSGGPIPEDYVGRRVGGFPGELTITFGQAFPIPVIPVSDATTQ